MGVGRGGSEGVRGTVCAVWEWIRQGEEDEEEEEEEEEDKDKDDNDEKKLIN